MLRCSEGKAWTFAVVVLFVAVVGVGGGARETRDKCVCMMNMINSKFGRPPRACVLHIN